MIGDSVDASPALSEDAGDTARCGWRRGSACRVRETGCMPEGDSLHRAAIRLQPLVGHRVSASSPNPRGLATGVARVVDGRVLESVEAIGKHLLLRFEGGVTVRSHLRMTGRWRIGRVGERRV